MVTRALCFFTFVCLFSSCISDTGKKNIEVSQELNPIKEGSDQTKTDKQIDFQLPEMKTVSVDSKVPRKEDWNLVKELTAPGIKPLGIAAYASTVFLTDTINKKLIRLDFNTEESTVVKEDCNAMYINQRQARLMMPMYMLDSVFVYRGPEGGFLKFDFPYELDKPSGMDGRRIDDFVVVDQGNHRVLRKTSGGYHLLGAYGSGKNQLNAPSSVVFAGNKIFITDTGNRRIQVLNEENVFESSFGEQNGLLRPTGITSDGQYLFVCDEGLKQIMVYLPTGKLAYILDGYTEDPSDAYFNDGKLYISDKSGATIKVLTNAVYNS